MASFSAGGRTIYVTVSSGVTLNKGDEATPTPKVTRNQKKKGSKAQTVNFNVCYGNSTKSMKYVRSYKASFSKNSTTASVSVNSTTRTLYSGYMDYNPAASDAKVYVYYGKKWYALYNVYWRIPAALDSTSAKLSPVDTPNKVYEGMNKLDISVTLKSKSSNWSSGITDLTISTNPQTPGVKNQTHTVKGTRTNSYVFTNLAAGSYKPIINVTDKYEKKTTFTYNTMTVNAVQKPTVGLNVVRCDENAKYKVDGSYARLDVEWSFDQMDGYVRERTILIDCYLLDGSYLFSQTWTNKTSSGKIDDTLLGIVSDGSSYLVAMEGGFMAERSYVFKITAIDKKYLGGEVSDSTTMTMAQFMIDLHPSGRSIGIGTIAPDPTDHPNGILKVGYDLILLNDLTVQKEVLVGKAVDKSQGGTVKVKFTRI